MTDRCAPTKNPQACWNVRCQLGKTCIANEQLTPVLMDERNMRVCLMALSRFKSFALETAEAGMLHDYIKSLLDEKYPQPPTVN